VPRSPRRRNSAAIIAAIALSIAAALPGCRRGTDSETSFVARVGNSSLTRAEMERFRASRPDSTVNGSAFVDQWIIDELLYQESERRGIASSDDVQLRAAEARRKIAIAALLDQTVYSDTTAPGDSVMVAYFRNHLPAFQLHDDMALVSFAAFSNREAANDFRTRVVSRGNWMEELSGLEADTVHRGVLVKTASRQYFTRPRLNPPELWKLASTLPAGDVSFVVTSGGLSYVLVVHSFLKAGAVPDFGAVQAEVRQRLIIDRRREIYDRLVSDLRSRAAVEVRPTVSAPPAHE
jgi:hypothetical protein